MINVDYSRVEVVVDVVARSEATWQSEGFSNEKIDNKGGNKCTLNF